MKNLTKTALIMSSILVMSAFPSAFADTVSEENEYDQCKHIFSFPQPPHATTETKVSKTTLEVWDQGFSNFGPQPQFKLSYDFPKLIREPHISLCVPVWELLSIEVKLQGWLSNNPDGTIETAICYQRTFTALEGNLDEKDNETITCNEEFRWYMNSDREMYLTVVPTYINHFTGEQNTRNLEVWPLTGLAD